MARKLSHYDRAGRARMVDVSTKSATEREAEASAFVAMNRDVLEALPPSPVQAEPGSAQPFSI